MIVRSHGMYEVRSHSGRVLGRHKTRRAALRQLRAVEYFKHHPGARRRGPRREKAEENPIPLIAWAAIALAGAAAVGGIAYAAAKNSAAASAVNSSTRPAPPTGQMPPAPPPPLPTAASALSAALTNAQANAAAIVAEVQQYPTFDPSMLAQQQTAVNGAYVALNAAGKAAQGSKWATQTPPTLTLEAPKYQMTVDSNASIALVIGDTLAVSPLTPYSGWSSPAEWRYTLPVEVTNVSGSSTLSSEGGGAGQPTSAPLYVQASKAGTGVLICQLGSVAESTTGGNGGISVTTPTIYITYEITITVTEPVTPPSDAAAAAAASAAAARGEASA